LIEHLERFLGRIQCGWTRDDDAAFSVPVVHMSGGCLPGIVSYCTLGLSRTAMPSPVSSKRISHELLLLVEQKDAARHLARIVQVIASEALSRNRPLLKGDTVPPRGSISAGSCLEAFYVTVPVYLPDEFAQHDGEGRSTAIAWLVPIARSEYQFIQTHGSEAFEDALARSGVALCDLTRPSLELCQGT
jgi:hypothetical protein